MKMAEYVKYMYICRKVISHSLKFSSRIKIIELLFPSPRLKCDLHKFSTLDINQPKSGGRSQNDDTKRRIFTNFKNWAIYSMVV